ncbi:MAG: fibronectin type III domain-containing protein [Opitutaceae bacterium]|nr:fibronectin type III domain-containing protein [Opitutaceae bacterium]
MRRCHLLRGEVLAHRRQRRGGNHRRRRRCSRARQRRRRTDRRHTRVYLSVVATNSVGGGASASSPEKHGTPLAPFAIATLASGHADSIAITWSAAGATSYDLLYGPTGGTATTTLTNAISDVTVSGLKSATSYDFQVRATSETGSITSELRAGLTRANVGIGLPGPTYWDNLHWMVDLVACSDFRKATAWSGASLDSEGWPTEDFRIIIAGQNEPAGDYAIRFIGSAANFRVDSGGTGAVTGVQYDAATNTTSAILRMTSPMTGLTSIVVTGTKRTAAAAAGTGITKLQIYRPGYPTDGSVLFTTEFLAAVRKFQAVRSMDYLATNQNPTREWSERSLVAWGGFGGASGTYTDNPHYLQFEGSWYPRGASWERLIQLANTAGVDLWINVPCRASDNYITNLANLLRYGSDGVTPYTAPTANPVYPPLNPELRLYLEYGNEVWNFAGGFMNYRWVQALAKDIHDNVPGHPINFDGQLATDNQWYTLSMERYTAYRSSVISQKFREVFGDAAMITRIRPVNTYQAGGGIASGLRWAAAYFQTTQPARAVNEIWYGAGGAAYYDSNVNPGSTEPSVMAGYFATLPNDQFARQTAGDATWAKTYSLKLVAYEAARAGRHRHRRHLRQRARDRRLQRRPAHEGRDAPRPSHLGFVRRRPVGLLHPPGQRALGIRRHHLHRLAHRHRQTAGDRRHQLGGPRAHHRRRGPGARPGPHGPGESGSLRDQRLVRFRGLRDQTALPRRRQRYLSDTRHHRRQLQLRRPRRGQHCVGQGGAMGERPVPQHRHPPTLRAPRALGPGHPRLSPRRSELRTDRQRRRLHGRRRHRRSPRAPARRRDSHTDAPAGPDRPRRDLHRRHHR